MFFYTGSTIHCQMYMHQLPIEFFLRVSVATRQLASGLCLLATLLQINLWTNKTPLKCDEPLNGEFHIRTMAHAWSCCKKKTLDKLEALLMVSYLLPSGSISVDWDTEVESSFYFQEKYFPGRFKEDVTPDWTFWYPGCMQRALV